MPNTMKTLRHLLLGPAILCGALPSSAQFATRDYVPMSFIQTQPAYFPQSAMGMGLVSGEARISIQIDDSGRLTDYLAVAYSHPVFLNAAITAIKTWQFKPALVHGASRSATAVLDFTFKAGVVVVDLSIETIPELVRSKLAIGAMSFRVCTLSELDKIPTPTKIVKPIYTPDQARRSHVSHVTVEFYIDEEGHVRLPSVSRQTNEAAEELCAAAITAVEQWQFEPPVSRGRPVLVLAQQDFDFRSAPPDRKLP
jgi:TonB family protein